MSRRMRNIRVSSPPANQINLLGTSLSHLRSVLIVTSSKIYTLRRELQPYNTFLQQVLKLHINFKQNATESCRNNTEICSQFVHWNIIQRRRNKLCFLMLKAAWNIYIYIYIYIYIQPLSLYCLADKRKRDNIHQNWSAFKRTHF